MLSKAPPVPQISPSETSEEKLRNEEAEAQIDSQTPTPEEELLPNQAVGDRIVEEQQLPATSNPNPLGVESSREIPSSVPSNQVPQNSDTRVQNPKPETRVVQKPDDRLFTLAAIGLTIAILVLLLKKFIKSTEHGAVFMDGS